MTTLGLPPSPESPVAVVAMELARGDGGGRGQADGSVAPVALVPCPVHRDVKPTMARFLVLWCPGE